ncbi:MAG: BON domain-containing protein [Bryobacterales bacterium]|nr:BON domain-containing protein [Bryobacteraceae bacterium]MDW8129345.1 BON domain-containing protein [Bryobacterales bacterium]
MRIVALALVLALLAGAAATAQQAGSDDEIYDQVRRRLANDPDVKGAAIEVEVREGVVTLRGKVREEKHKIKAERITRRVKGVKKVINELRVGIGIE